MILNTVEEQFADYLARVSTAKNLYPSWRMGQTYFNVLHDLRPDIANKLRATVADPFYNDELIGAFLSVVYAEWAGIGY